MRLTRAERKAALAVLAMTGAVVVSGIKLLKKHTKYMTQKAAAFFKDGEDEGQESAVAPEGETTRTVTAEPEAPETESAVSETAASETPETNEP